MSRALRGVLRAEGVLEEREPFQGRCSLTLCRESRSDVLFSFPVLCFDSGSSLFLFAQKLRGAFCKEGGNPFLHILAVSGTAQGVEFVRKMI
jgi:hypothetical protein